MGDISSSLSNDVSPTVNILNVGHGNSAVVRFGGYIMVVDAAPGPALRNELVKLSAKRVEELLLSHADFDHIGGAIGLLSTVQVGTLRYNSDGIKDSAEFRDLATYAYKLFKDGRLSVKTQLDNTIGDVLSSGDLKVRVVHPNLLTSSTGPRPRDHPGCEVTANGMSAVVHIRLEPDGGSVLLAADLDSAGLDDLLEGGEDLRASVLVFPHHGGRSGSDDYEFAKRIVQAVDPDLIVFSLGRERYANPRREVLKAIRETSPKARIACTQLSRNCADGTLLLAIDQSNGSTPSISPSTCAGRISVDLSFRSIFSTERVGHQDFVSNNIPDSMCN